MIYKAIDTCKEILRLNESDNTGIRFLLMGLYAYLEDEDSLKKLCKKYAMCYNLRDNYNRHK